VGANRGDGAGNGTRDVRRRVVADLRDDPAARSRPADRLEPPGALDGELTSTAFGSAVSGNSTRSGRRNRGRPSGAVPSSALAMACSASSSAARRRGSPQTPRARRARAGRRAASTLPNAAWSPRRRAPARVAVSRPTPSRPWSPCTAPAARTRGAAATARRGRRAPEAADSRRFSHAESRHDVLSGRCADDRDLHNDRPIRSVTALNSP
jgi:hypothetical protein